MPVVVWLLSLFLPDYPPLLRGVYLVLLTPCIDFVIVFKALGKGNEKLTLMSTPFLFITQMLLLPFYLWLFMGEVAAKIVEPAPFLEVFFALIVIPLVLALAIQLYARKATMGMRLMDLSAWVPVPFMAITLFVVVSFQIGKLSGYMDLIIKVVPIYAVFMVVVPIIARFIAKLLKLDVSAGRALIFSRSTRNSLFVFSFT